MMGRLVYIDARDLLCSLGTEASLAVTETQAAFP